MEKLEIIFAKMIYSGMNFQKFLVIYVFISCIFCIISGLWGDWMYPDKTGADMDGQTVTWTPPNFPPFSNSPEMLRTNNAGNIIQGQPKGAWAYTDGFGFAWGGSSTTNPPTKISHFNPSSLL